MKKPITKIVDKYIFGEALDRAGWSEEDGGTIFGEQLLDIEDQSKQIIVDACNELGNMN